jgi:hypothetical protein
MTGTKDDVLIQLVKQFEEIFVSIEDQGSLLEDKIDEHLNEEEEMEAQAEYEREINPPKPQVPAPAPNFSVSSSSQSQTAPSASSSSHSMIDAMGNTIGTGYGSNGLGHANIHNMNYNPNSTHQLVKQRIQIPSSSQQSVNQQSLFRPQSGNTQQPNAQPQSSLNQMSILEEQRLAHIRNIVLLRQQSQQASLNNQPSTQHPSTQHPSLSQHPKPPSVKWQVGDHNPKRSIVMKLIHNRLLQKAGTGVWSTEKVNSAAQKIEFDYFSASASVKDFMNEHKLNLFFDQFYLSYTV